MNPEEQTTESTEVQKEKHPVFQVTPLSKYLAMLLFIIMPFLGGWIGYTYAPEKVIEVEKIVILEKEGDSQSRTEAEQVLDIYSLEEYKTLDLEEGVYRVKLPQTLVVRGLVSLEKVDGEYVRAGQPFEVRLDEYSVAQLPGVFFNDPDNKKYKSLALNYTEDDFTEGSVVEITFDAYLHSTRRAGNLDSVEVIEIDLVE
jgi:hypothetical protein